MNFKSFIKECHKKEVFKKLSLYIVTSWVIIQVLATTWEPLGLPKESVTVLLIILLVGFPINVYLVWRYHLLQQEPEQKKFEKDGVERPGKLLKSPFQRTYFTALTAISILVIGIIMVIVKNNFMYPISIETIDASDKIAVETFGNNTGDPKKDIIGKMAADWIIHGISENNIGQVISQKTIDDYSEIVVAGVSPSRSNSLLKDYFNPGKIISGNFYEKGDKLLFQGSLTNANKNDEQISFKLIECDAESPLDCIEQLKQLILGYLVVHEKKEFTLESSPPKFDAYQHVITARANVKNNEIYIEGIEKAIAADPDYFEPKLLEIVFYYNRQDFFKSDSLLQQIRPNSNTTARQMNLLNMYKSLLEGDNRNAYEYLFEEYNNNTFDIETNQSLMVLALQFINRPELADPIFEKIPSEDFIIENCLYCEYRIYVKAMADIQLKKYDQAILILEETLKKVDAFYLNKPLASAYIRSNKNEDLDKIVTLLELSHQTDEMNELYLFIIGEYLLKNNKKMANNYLNRIKRQENSDSNYSLAEAQYLLGEYKNAEAIFRQLHNEDHVDKKNTARLATCLIKNGKIEEGERVLNALENLRSDYEYGAIDYLKAQHFAVTDNEISMFNHLLKSISQGNHYTITQFQNDPHFVAYFDREEFRSILNYWH